MYKEPEWENKREENFSFLNNEEREVLKEIINEIPFGAKAELVIQLHGNKEIEKNSLFMGHWQYEIFRQMIDDIPAGLRGKLIVCWNGEHYYVKKIPKRRMQRFAKINRFIKG